MSHSAPFLTSSSLSPESTRRSRILQTDGIYPDSQTFRRSFQAQHGSYDKKELEMQICRNFEEIISRSDSKNSGDFKTNLKKLDPHNLMFLADYYYRKLISEKNCRSKTFDCEVIKSFFIDDPTNPLISSFYNRLERLFKHDFTNPAKTNIKSKFLKTDIDSDQNNFFKKLISSILRHEQELNSSLVKSSHADNLSKSLSPSLATSFNFLKETVDSSRLSSSSFSPSSLSDHIFQPKVVEISNSIDLKKIALFILSDKEDESSLKQYKEYAIELLDYIIESSSIDNAVSLKYRGAIDKHLLKRIETKIVESTSPEKTAKLSKLYEELKETLQEKPQHQQIFSKFSLKFTSHKNQASLIDHAKKLRANPLNRSIDKAIELFNKIATKCNVSEKLSELKTKAPMEISTPEHKLSNGDIRKKLSNYYKLKQKELFTL